MVKRASKRELEEQENVRKNTSSVYAISTSINQSIGESRLKELIVKSRKSELKERETETTTEEERYRVE